MTDQANDQTEVMMAVANYVIKYKLSPKQILELGASIDVELARFHKWAERAESDRKLMNYYDTSKNSLQSLEAYGKDSKRKYPERGT